MTTTRKELIVGLVFFAIMVFIGVFTILIRGINPLKPPQDLIVYFKDGVGGLREGNVVRIAGLEVGQVEKMRLAEVGVVTYIRVQRGVKIFPGYEVTVRAFSALGGKYVDITRGEQHKEPLELTLTKADYYDIEVGPETPVHLAGKGDTPLRGDLEAELISALAELAENIKPDVENAVRNIREVTEKINDVQGTLGGIIGDEELYKSIKGAAQNLEMATAQFAEVSRKVNEGGGTVAKMLNDSAFYDETTEALRRVKNIVTKVDEGKGPAGRLINSERMADSIENSLANVERLLATVSDPDGRGTVPKLLNDPRLYEDLVASIGDLRKILTVINEGKSPVGVLVTSESAGASLERTLANIEKTTDALSRPKGTVGRLIHDDRLINEVERVMVEFRESVEDLREQAPINAFVSAVFQTF